MPFDRAWDTSYEADPAGTDIVGQGATVIRNLKVAVRQRLEPDHDIGDAAADVSGHNQLSFVKEYGANAAPADRTGVHATIFVRDAGPFYEQDGTTKPFLLGTFPTNLPEFTTPIATGDVTTSTSSGDEFPSATSTADLVIDEDVGLYAVEVDASSIGHVILFMRTAVLLALDEADYGDDTTSSNSLTLATSSNSRVRIGWHTVGASKRFLVAKAGLGAAITIRFWKVA